MNYNDYSLKSIFRKHKLKIALTLMLVVLELISTLLFPLFMGFAINDLMIKNYDGLYVLAGLVLFSVVIGSIRRFYDSRVYGSIYIKTAESLVLDEKNKGASTSRITARIGLLTELVEFFENSFPEIINGVIGLVGTILIIGGINYKVCLLCLGIILVILIVYGITSKLNMSYHKSYNDELETLVDRVESDDKNQISDYLRNITRINIKLSDLETFNFASVLTFAMGVFIVSMMISVDQTVNYGQIVSLLIYVFEFIEKVVIMPLFYQNYLRLREISDRLSQ